MWSKIGKSGKGNAKGLNMNEEKRENLVFLVMLHLKPLMERQLACSGRGSQRTPPIYFFKIICVQSVQVKEHHSLLNCFG